MRHALLFLSSLLLLTACRKKKEDKSLVRQYPQEYSVVYYGEQDSVFASGTLASKSISSLPDVPVTMTMNGMAADAVSEINKSYGWHFKGLKDVVFNFSKQGNTLVNTIKAADIVRFGFADLPDTVSLATWKSIKINGPAMTQDDQLYVRIYFSDNRKHENFADSSVYKFPDQLLHESLPLGKTRCWVSWSGKPMSLQMSDGNAGGSMQWTSVIEKQIVLVP